MEVNILPNRPQTDFLELALKSENGNPFPMLSMTQRTGGAKSRMAERLQQAGYLDDGNAITLTGIEACLRSMARQRLHLGFRTVRRMIFYPEQVNDETCRCITCGQIDEEPWHEDHVCKAMLKLIYDSRSKPKADAAA